MTRAATGCDAAIYRLVCPHCRFVFLRVIRAAEEGVECPRCRAPFNPDEEELVDPEDD